MAKNIDDIFESIIQDSQSIVTAAFENAAKKAQADIIKESYRQLAKYYANYKPKMYKRTKRLHKAITPVFLNKSNNNEILFEVGVEYDSNKLKGFYRSNSWYHKSGTEWFGREDPYFDFDSQNNGIPEPWWIMNNFLEGIHPWGQVDSESASSLMEEFFDTTLRDHVNMYVSEAITNNLIRELKKRGK